MYQWIKNILSGQRGGDTIEHMNRSVIVVYPQAPYLKWMGAGAGIPGSDPEKDGTAYLIPMMEDQDEFDDAIDQVWDWLFTHQLSLSSEDKAGWPKNRSLNMFREWFDVRVADMVIDIADEPLRVD